MNAHAYTKLGAVGPDVLGKPALRCDRRRHRVLGATEGDEERVPLRVDLVAAVLGERLAQDPLVIGERVAVAISQLLEQLRRTLDVSKEEGDRADRQLRGRAHARLRITSGIPASSRRP